ncbi:dehydrogenase/reductase SDR family member on chromosome X-like isoform X2 [Electrophorus electricus]|uniref:dehydrogenase/reductase SDR family member on chromosome X-like isoform X2 n=1 Tax=Electrophorus electricus TaxID=8005 RepID=UPI0015D01EA8|nr:dehydrogenase/reductase SDR family member on chromosome X-like isoform X2 [Electrophorus electricus]
MSVLARVLPVLKLYLTAVKVLFYQLLHKPFAVPALPKQHGKVAIVTGGARGLGYAIVRQLAGLGMHVIIASHDKKQGLAAVKSIREEQSRALVDFEFVDLASLSSVRQFVCRFQAQGLPLHVLINNAAVMLVPEGKTDDGFELHFATNYLGHFLLTRFLLDTLVHSGKDEACSRIISISSSAHYTADKDFLFSRSMQHYSAHGAYAHSKLAQVLFTYRLQQELQSSGCAVTASAVDPGVVDTHLYRNLSTPARLAQRLIAHLLFRSPAQAAATAVYAAASPELEGVGGCYLYEGKRVSSSALSYDVELQAQLWRRSCSLLGLADSLYVYQAKRGGGGGGAYTNLSL